MRKLSYSRMFIGRKYSFIRDINEMQNVALGKCINANKNTVFLYNWNKSLQIVYFVAIDN